VHRAEQRARDLLDAEDVPAARQVTAEALRDWPDRPELLWLLADVEFADGDQKAAMCCLTEAVKAKGGDAAAISKQIGALSENRLWRETLTTVKRIPERVRDDPLVRTAIGDFYRILGCHGHAVSDGYRESSGLSSSAREKRRRSWLRSGGPFTFVRRRVDTWEESQLLSDLGKDLRAAVHLDDLPYLDSRQAHRLKVRMENGYYEWSYYYELLSAVGRWLLRLLPAAFLPVWLVLYAVVSTAGFISGPPGVVGGTAISAVVALGLAILILRSLLRGDLAWHGIQPTLGLFAFLCTIAVLGEIAVAEGYDHHGLPTAGWWAWVVFGLVVLPAVGVSMSISAGILSVLGGRPFKRVTRGYCQVILLDVFLSMLLDMQSLSRQLDLEQRLEWSRLLELSARRISQDLLPSSFLSHIAAASADWLKQRAAGWAEALRQMQREIVVSVPGRQPKLEAKLRREIRALATGDLMGLPWRLPPPSPSRRTTLVRKTIEISRTILVAALPLGFVLVLQAVLHFNTGAFRWAIIGTAVWPLLYVVISLDPAIRDKIDTARSLAQTVNEARRGSG
jgi:hypothetical protein